MGILRTAAICCFVSVGVLQDCLAFETKPGVIEVQEPKTAIRPLLTNVTSTECANNECQVRMRQLASAKSNAKRNLPPYEEILLDLQSDDRDKIRSALPILINFRDHDDAIALLRAIWLKDQSAYPNLSWDILSEDRYRASVARILGQNDRQNFQEYYDFIVNNFDHDELSVRLAVATALGSLGGDEVIPLLEQMIVFDNKYVGLNAIGSLGYLGTPKAKNALVRLEENPNLDSDQKDLIQRKLNRYVLKSPTINEFPRCPGEIDLGNVPARSDLAKQIRTRSASFDDLKTAFTFKRMQPLVNSLNAMVVYAGDPMVQDLFEAAWQHNQSLYPDFSWRCLSEPLPRVTIASFLAFADTTRDNEYLDFLRLAVRDQNFFVRDSAALALEQLTR